MTNNRKEYPRTEVEEPRRPFRLWDAVAKKQLQHRFYQYPKRAHLGALIEARWAEIGTTIEVFDARNGRLLGQYTRRVNSVHFIDGSQSRTESSNNKE